MGHRTTSNGGGTFVDEVFRRYGIDDPGRPAHTRTVQAALGEIRATFEAKPPGPARDRSLRIVDRMMRENDDHARRILSDRLVMMVGVVTKALEGTGGGD